MGFVGVLGGPVTATATDGEDTEVVMVHLSNFGPGVQASFTGIDPDFTGDSSSGVRVLDMEGSRAFVLFSDGTSGFGEFEPTDNGTLRAVITK